MTSAMIRPRCRTSIALLKPIAPSPRARETSTRARGRRSMHDLTGGGLFPAYPGDQAGDVGDVRGEVGAERVEPLPLASPKLPAR